MLYKFYNYLSYTPRSSGCRFLPTLSMLALCISLTGCGFKPLLKEDPQTKTDVQADLRNVKIALIKDRFGQLVRNRLLTLMHLYGENVSPDYELVVHVSEVERGLTIQRDYIGERFEKGLKATFSIKDLRCDKTVFSERTEFYTSYSMGSAAEFVAYYSTVAEEDAVERLTQVLADDIYTRVASVMREQKDTCLFDKTLNKTIADSANEDSSK